MDPASLPLPTETRADAAPTRRDAALAFLLAFVALASCAWARDLWDADEGRYASVAIDMLRSGDFVTPRQMGMRFMDKPPLVYWMECGAFAVLGPTPFAARLPCVVAGAGLALLGFLFAAAWTRSRRAAWCAAIVVATSGAGVVFSRVVTMDMPLSTCVAGALYAAWRALSSDAVGWRALLGACIGLGLLAKGPLAGALTGAVAIGWGVVGVSWRRVARIAFSPTAWVVAIALAAPWYALCERSNPGYLEHFALYEHWGRIRDTGNREFAPIWLYAAVLPVFLLPWTFLLRRAPMPRPITEGTRRPVPAHRFAWAWTIAVLVLLSPGRNRLFTYALPAFLPLAILAGARMATTVRRPLRLAAAVFAVGTVLTLLAARVFDSKLSARDLAATLVRQARPGDAIVCLDLLPQGLRFYERDLYVSVAGKQREIVEPWASKDGAGRLMDHDALHELWRSPRRVVLVAREAKAKPFVERGGTVLATGLAGAQRFPPDLWVVENRPLR